MTKVHGVHFLEELGKTEATWVLEVQRFGPFFVDMDARGNNYFENLDAETRARVDSLHQRLGIPEGFDFTDVNSSANPGTR